jgi:hypothetical protein
LIGRIAVLLVLLYATVSGAGTADISIRIGPDRHAAVRERFSLPKTEGFEFLASPCGRIGNLMVDGRPESIPASPGPWIPAPGGLDYSYEVIPNDANPRSCAIPILMPKTSLDPVSLIVEDAGSGLANVSLPHMSASKDRKRWTATLPAVPSKIDLVWADGDAAPISGRPLETGLFRWNFWGLVSVLVIWTIAYLLWARRQA